jgi:hypothetical protein
MRIVFGYEHVEPRRAISKSRCVEHAVCPRFGRQLTNALEPDM